MPACPSNMNRQSSARDDRRDRPRHQHRGAHQRAPAEGAVHARARAGSPSTSSRVTVATVNNTCAPSACAEARIADGLEVVGQTDERPAEPGHPEVVQVQRLPERPEQRKQRDAEATVPSAGAASQPAQAGLAALRGWRSVGHRTRAIADRAFEDRRYFAARSSRPQRPLDRGASASPRRRGERLGRLQLPGQRAVQIDLQDARESCV